MSTIGELNEVLRLCMGRAAVARVEAHFRLRRLSIDSQKELYRSVAPH